MSQIGGPTLISRRKFTAVLIALLACASTKTTFAQTGIAEDAVVEMVERAAKAIAENGLKDATRYAPSGTWVREDFGLYVFVFDNKGTLLLHPQEHMIGINIAKTRDVNGEKFIAKILYLTKKHGGTTWTEYLWLHPTDGRIRKKRVYSKKVGEVIVSCGYYLGHA